MQLQKWKFSLSTQKCHFHRRSRGESRGHTQMHISCPWRQVFRNFKSKIGVLLEVLLSWLPVQLPVHIFLPLPSYSRTASVWLVSTCSQLSLKKVDCLYLCSFPGSALSLLLPASGYSSPGMLLFTIKTDEFYHHFSGFPSKECSYSSDFILIRKISSFYPRRQYFQAPPLRGGQDLPGTSCMLYPSNVLKLCIFVLFQ